MSELVLILRTQLQFYRRHPLISTLFLLGLTLGTALISAITHLNTEAGQRYQTASDQTVSPVHYLIKPIAGQTYLPGSLWFELRKRGIHASQPVLTGRVLLEDGRSVLIRGVNTLALLTQNTALASSSPSSSTYSSSFPLFSNTAQFVIATELASRLAPSSNAVISKTTTSKAITSKGVASKKSTSTTETSDNSHSGEHLSLSSASNQSIQFKAVNQSYDYITKDDIGPWLITDISVAHRILHQQGVLPSNQPYVSLIELGQLTQKQYQQVSDLIGDTATLSDVSQQHFDALSESFFFNLTALALLGYAVGLFLSLNALKVMLSARNQMQTQLATLGCLPQRLMQALNIELLIVCAGCAAVGNSLGFWIAQSLIFDVTTTLVSLYQLDRALEVHWQWESFAIGFAMNILALAALLVSLQWEQTHTSLNNDKENPTQRNEIKTKQYLLFFLLLAVGVGIYFSASTKVEALLLCAWLIVVFSFISLPLLRFISNFKLSAHLNIKQKASAQHFTFPLSSFSSYPLAQWLKANTSMHLRDINLAILAFLIALGAAIGTQVMVRSFALTLDAYLQQRLQADLYLRPPASSQYFNAKHAAKLQQLPETKLVSGMITAETTVGEAQASSLQVISYGNHAKHFQHINRTDDPPVSQMDIHDGRCLANEPSQLRYGKKIGDTLVINQGTKRWQCQISGFYYDYGTQRMNVIVSQNALDAAQFQTHFVGYGITLNEGVSSDTLIPLLMKDFDYTEESIIQNATYKRIAKSLFSRTFAVTDVLNTLIVTIALIAIWVSFMSMNQQQKNQFGIVQAMGITPTQLFFGQLIVTSLLLLLTLLLAIPLGIGLGHVLLKFVMPISFGWSMPMIIDWPNIAKLCATVLAIAFIVSAFSIWKLQKHPIADLVKEKL